MPCSSRAMAGDVCHRHWMCDQSAPCRRAHTQANIHTIRLRTRISPGDAESIDSNQFQPQTEPSQRVSSKHLTPCAQQVTVSQLQMRAPPRAPTRAIELPSPLLLPSRHLRCSASPLHAIIPPTAANRHLEMADFRSSQEEERETLIKGCVFDGQHLDADPKGVIRGASFSSISTMSSIYDGPMLDGSSPDAKVG